MAISAMCLFVAMSEQHGPLLPVTVSCGLQSFTFHLEHRVTLCTVVTLCALKLTRVAPCAGLPRADDDLID